MGQVEKVKSGNTIDGSMIDGNTLDSTLSLRDPTDGELSPDDEAAIRAFAAKHELSVDALLSTARASKRRAQQGEAGGGFLVDTAPASPKPSMSVRTAIQLVRQRGHVPLEVAPFTDQEWELIEPHFRFCKSRTLQRRIVLWSAVKYALGHAASKSAADLTVSAFLSYEIARYNGSRITALANAMEGVLSEHRCRELQALVSYLQERAQNRAVWLSMN